MRIRQTTIFRSQDPRPERPSLPLSSPDLAGGEFVGAIEALATGWVAPGGPMVQRFEDAVREITGFRYAVATVSCTAALHLAVRVLEVGPGDEVWCPTLTFIASLAPAVQVGAIPRLLDVDSSTWTLDTNLLEEELRLAAKRGKPPRLVIAADLFGHPVDVDAIGAICAEYGVPVLCDCAASLGSLVRGHHAGRGAQIACISFNGNKIVTTGGGGVLLTDDADLATRARKLAAQAREPTAHYEHRSLGHAYLLPNISAAIGLAQLSDLERRVTRRREIFEAYRFALSSMGGIHFQSEAFWAFSNRWLTAFLFDQNWEHLDIRSLALLLRKHNIDVRPIWQPLHCQPVFSGALRAGGSIAESIARRGICLPSGSQLSAACQGVIVQILFEALEALQ